MKQIHERKTKRIFTCLETSASFYLLCLVRNFFIINYLKLFQKLSHCVELAEIFPMTLKSLKSDVIWESCAYLKFGWNSENCQEVSRLQDCALLASKKKSCQSLLAEPWHKISQFLISLASVPARLKEIWSYKNTLWNENTCL